DVAVQEESQAQQHDGFHPAQGALLAKDARAGAASDSFRINGPEDGNLPLVVQLQVQEKLREPTAENQLVVQKCGPELFVAAAVDIRALEQPYESLTDLHGQHAGIAREERRAVDKRVAGRDAEG